MLFDYDPYYRPRQTEDDLCRDFPGDEILIDGLHAMQSHFWNNNVPIDIPVVRLMNAVHYLAAYMLSTQCEGDQLEYDVLAAESLGRDRRLIPLVMIVLAAMLKRTEGFRAVHCRNVILSDRSEDFEEGVCLYDRFLRSAEKHFAEEDFLIDTHTQIAQQQEEIDRLISENIELKYTLTQMEAKLTQINIGTQNNNCTQIDKQYNITYITTTSAAPDCSGTRQTSTPDMPQEDLFKYIHVCVTDENERAEIHRTVCNIVRLPKMQLVCKELYKLMKSRKVLCSINPESMLSELRRLGLPSADVNGFSDKNFYHYYKAPKVD